MSDRFSRIDPHVHTRFSQNAGDWLLKILGADESYTEPRQVYETAKARGMQYVTISDHDTIDGAAEIAHYPDFFISEEVTTWFPEDLAKVHVVCLDIDQEIHRELQYLRENIYDLVHYLHSQNIVHFIAHPFFRMSRVLNFEHFEKMLLLFKTFEVRNGGKQLLPEKLLSKVLKGLTRDRIMHLADRYDMAPVGREPWIKHKVAGSDDHGGILISTPHTVCPISENKGILLDHIRDGHSRASGHGGTMLSVAHQIMAVTYKYARQHKKSLPVVQSKIAWNMLDHVFQAGQKHPFTTWTAGLYFSMQGLFSIDPDEATDNQDFNFERILKTTVIQDKTLQGLIKGELVLNHRHNLALFHGLRNIFDDGLKAIATGNSNGANSSSLLEKFGKLKSMLTLLPLFAPYAIAARTECQDRHLMRQAANTFIMNGKYYRGKIAVFTDTLTLHGMNQPLPGRMLGNETVSRVPFYFGLSDTPIRKHYCIGYKKLCSFTLNEETKQELQIPSLLQVLYDLVSKDFEVIYIKSLDSMAVVGALLGKLLNIPVVARFPGKVIHKWLNSIQDRNQLKAARMILQLFYSQMDEILIRSKSTRELLLSLQIDPQKANLYPYYLENGKDTNHSYSSEYEMSNIEIIK